MIQKGDDFKWGAVETFDDAPGSWVGLTRQVLMRPNGTKFETRFFEIAPSGYTTFERHQHEHNMIVLRGRGKVRIHDEWLTVEAPDAIYVPAYAPHQLKNEGTEPFGYLCVVDKERDQPVLLDSEGLPRTS